MKGELGGPGSIGTASGWGRGSGVDWDSAGGWGRERGEGNGSGFLESLLACTA